MLLILTDIGRQQMPMFAKDMTFWQSTQKCGKHVHSGFSHKIQPADSATNPLTGYLADKRRTMAFPRSQCLGGDLARSRWPLGAYESQWKVEDGTEHPLLQIKAGVSCDHTAQHCSVSWMHHNIRGASSFYPVMKYFRGAPNMNSMKLVIPLHLIVLVNSHQRWKQTRNRVCFHL